MKDQRRDRRMHCRIRVQGRIGAQWSGWFGDMAIVPQGNGETLLSGPVADQAALHGILARIRDMNLPLISLECVPGE